MTRCCNPNGKCWCRTWFVRAAMFILAGALILLWLLMVGCAAGKKFEKGPDGTMRERVVVGFDVATAAEGVNATIGSLTDPGTMAALAGVGVPVVGIVGALIGKWRGERKGWDEAKADAHEATKAKESAWDEATARTLLAAGAVKAKTDAE